MSGQNRSGQSGPPESAQRESDSQVPLPRDTYTTNAEGNIRYIPVTRQGDVIGYLWASPRENAAGFVRRMASPHNTFAAAVVWSERFEEANEERILATDLLRHWAGQPEDPDGGGVAADAEEQDAANLAELYEIVNPGGEPPEPTPSGDSLPEGFIDRSKDWGEPSPTTMEEPPYAFQTDSAIRYFPVVRGGEVLGYLWASTTEEAADYERRRAAGAEGFLAGGLWLARLEQCKQEGLSALQALRRWVGEPEDPKGGGIAADAPEQEAPSLDALQEITQAD